MSTADTGNHPSLRLEIAKFTLAPGHLYCSFAVD